MLLGLLPASAGQVRLFGGPPSRQARRRLGYVPQGLGLYDDLTPAENLAFTGGRVRPPAGRGQLPPAPGRGCPPEVRRYGRELVGDLPLGVQRRVAFAAALQHHPDLLILDEPTSGWTRWPGPGCGRRSRAAAARAPGSWSPPTTWTRPGSAAGWSSWRTDGWWPRARRPRSPAAGGSAWSRLSRGRRRWTRWRRRACPPRWPGARCGCPAPARPRWPAPSARCRPGSATPRPPWKNASSSSRCRAGPVNGAEAGGGSAAGWADRAARRGQRHPGSDPGRQPETLRRARLRRRHHPWHRG